MKLLQRLKIRKELKRLEDKARETPSPSTYVDLGQGYINLGMPEHTLRVAEEGLSLFPTAQELRTLHRVAKRKHLRGCIEELAARVEKAPDPGLFRELAGLYLEVGDYAAVRRTCEDCIRRFPEDEGAYLVLGRTCLARFYRDLHARDGLEAVRCLKRVVALDPAHAAAQKLLAEVLFRAGASGSALYHLQILRGLLPGDPEVQALYQAAVARPTRDDDLDALFHAVEARRQLASAPINRAPAPERVASERSIGSIRASLAQIAEIPGVVKAAYMKGSKALVKGDIRDGKDAFLRVVRVVARSAQRTSRRLDIGSFSKGVLEGSFGHICLCCFGEVVAAVMCSKESPVERILTELQELVAGSLYLTGANSP